MRIDDEYERAFEKMRIEYEFEVKLLRLEWSGRASLAEKVRVGAGWRSAWFV